MKKCIVVTDSGYKYLTEVDGEGRVLLTARKARSAQWGVIRLSVCVDVAINSPSSTRIASVRLAIEDVPEDMPKDKMQERLRSMCALAATRNNVDYVIMWEGE